MNNEDSQFIKDLLDQVEQRPGMLAGRAAGIEIYIAAVEFLLWKLHQVDLGYSQFKSQGQFGNEPFTAMFERQNACSFGFVKNLGRTSLDESRQLEQEFLASFRKHLSDFRRMLEGRLNESQEH